MAGKYCMYNARSRNKLIEVYVYYSYPNIRNVSLTFLRGLEVAELKEEDMPMV